MLHFLVAPGCAPTARPVRENAENMVVLNGFMEQMLIVWWFFNDFGSGRLLELSWDLLVPSCGPLGGSWRLLGSFLGLAWATWAPLGASWGLFVIFLEPLGGSWRLLGRLLGLAWAVPLMRLASGSE